MKLNKSAGRILGIAAALLSNIIFGLSFIFSKKALMFAHPLIIVAVRFTVAFLVMNFLVLIRAWHIHFKGKNLTKLLFMGIAQPLCYFIAELYGIKYTSSALSGLIIALVPVAVMIISTVFLKEKPTVLQAICTAVSLISVSAVAVLSDDGGKNHFFGIVLLVVAVISAAVFNIISGSESSVFSPFERTYFMFLIGTLGYNIIAFSVFGSGYVTEFSKAAVCPEFWISIGYLSVISSVVAFLSYNFATSKITAVEASSFSNIITVVSVLAGVFIAGEDFSKAQFLWCIPIILGVWGVNIKKD